MTPNAESRALSDAEYEPIRSALFDRRNGSASEAKRAIGEALYAAGFALVRIADPPQISNAEWHARRLADMRLPPIDGSGT